MKLIYITYSILHIEKNENLSHQVKCPLDSYLFYFFNWLIILFNCSSSVSTFGMRKSLILSIRILSLWDLYLYFICYNFPKFNWKLFEFYYCLPLYMFVVKLFYFFFSALIIFLTWLRWEEVIYPFWCNDGLIFKFKIFWQI